MEKGDTLGADRGPQRAEEPEAKGPATGGGDRGEERGKHEQEEAAEPRVGAAHGERPRREGASERGERRRAPAGERESGVCAALLVNKKERGGASYCSAGKLQPALLIGLTEP